MSRVQLSYETAVFTDDVVDLTDKIVKLINSEASHLTDERIRNSVIAASLITSAQFIDRIDGVEQPFVPMGVSGLIRRMVGRWG